MHKLYKYSLYIVGAVCIACLLSLRVSYKRNRTLSNELDIAMNNQKALFNENKGLTDSRTELRLTVAQLSYYNDSLLMKMNSVRKELKVKDKQLKRLQYIQSKATRTDTIIYRDTIFNENVVKLDTTIQDEWYTLNLNLSYPNIITVNPTFVSEKYIVTSTKRETVNPPKKCAIARWFQKKHTVVKVDIVERNPYIENSEQRFIEIIK